jgi:hypothetical protein
MDFEFDFSGLNGTLKSIDSLTKNANSEILDKLERVGRVVLSESVKRCPVDTGFLAGSGYYGLGSDKGSPSVEIGFNAWYAVFVHEINRKYTGVQSSRFGTSGGDWKGWKFLERAIQDNKNKIQNVLLYS